jgi:hypothetical protein
LGQIRAVTGNGDEVILYNNGTWKYANKLDSVKKEIPLNPKKFLKNIGSTFEVKSNAISSVSVFINPKTWSFEKVEGGQASEYKFLLREKSAYGMMISEKISIPLETLKNIALQNAKKAAPDARLAKEEYRIVNGVKVLFMQMDGTIQGVTFSYYGYYYSSKSGSLQLITYTSQDLFASYQSEFEIFLNGLVITENNDK